jgi:hypothetical protein
MSRPGPPITSAAARNVNIVPSRFVWTTSMARAGSSVSGVGPPSPALATTTSRLPHSSIARLAAASTAEGSRTSATMCLATPPW